jgi:hypothetical protein
VDGARRRVVVDRHTLIGEHSRRFGDIGGLHRLSAAIIPSDEGASHFGTSSVFGDQVGPSAAGIAQQAEG